MLRKKIGKEIIIPKIIIITGMIVILLMIRMSTNPPMTIDPIIEPQEEEIVLINENTPNLPQFSVGQWGMDTNLSKANASFIGEAITDSNRHDLSGYSVAGAGDVNNDGYDDILIGAPAKEKSEGKRGAGQTYLILGRPTTDWQMDLNLSEADASFIGENRSDNSGWSVAGAGDVNKDGYDDILIGAIGDDDGGDLAGQTYLILGRPTTDWQMALDLSEANASFIGEGMDEYYGDKSGWSVAGAGDVNNDGYDDILIGAPYNNESGTMAGQTYLILGRPTANWQMDLDLSAASASFLGEGWDDQSGTSVAGAGDVNNDGYDDILIGAPGNSEGGWLSGQTYLILGRPTANWQMDLDLSAASASFIGEDWGDESGWSVAGAGDVNKDGYNDILIGAIGDDDGGDLAGQTYLILGRPTANWQMDLDLSAASASFIGEDSDDHSGTSVTGIGDVNKDGYDDILIGATWNGEGGYRAGQTYLILGRPTTDWQMDLDLSAASASFIGENSDDYSGWSVAGTGDVNNDGYDDILIGAYGNKEGGIGLNPSETAGQTYLILGYIRIDITSPTETTYRQNSVTLIYSVSDSTVTIYIDDEANTTALPSGTIISTLSEGSHNITIDAVDVLGNVGKATVIFNVDTIPPTVTIDSPIATTYPNDMISISLSGDATYYWYYIVGVDVDNQTWTPATQRSLDDGTYTLH
ncbi:MAG: integrin alpha, partial [Promethearchaeota archaeon]